MTAESIENPILNGPYDPPARHFELSPSGPTGAVVESRRESESFIPVPPPKKGQKNQQSFDLDVSGERRQKNDLINEIRYQVGLWRGRGYPNVTPISRKLLLHWADPTRENRVMFCQREAVGTAIFLTEAAHRQGGPVAAASSWGRAHEGPPCDARRRRDHPRLVEVDERLVGSSANRGRSGEWPVVFQRR